MLRGSVKRGVILVGVFSLFCILYSFLFLSSINEVNAFGISTPYLENNTLRVLPGQNYTYTLSLQNGDEEAYYVDMSYSSTKNIVTLEQATYYINAKTYDNKFDFRINIPSDAQFGDRFILEYSAKPRTTGNGTITLGVEIKRDVKILVTNETGPGLEPAISLIIAENTSKENNQYIELFKKAGKYIIAIVIVIILVILIMRLWTLSMKLSKKLERKSKTTHTISQAISLAEVRTLMQKLSDEEFELPEIRALFKNKLSELTNNEIVTEISHISRREAIIALDHILKW